MKPIGTIRWTRGRFLIGILIVAAGVGGFFWVRALHPSGQTVQQAKAVYYCPMHPSYTSDRPGDCPICNMRLVKRQPAQKAASLEDVCILHNCPKVHEGAPCPMMVVAKSGEKVTCPLCGSHIAGGSPRPARKILYWTDPMIPGFRSDKRGKSPMGMELVPVYEEAVGTTGPGGGASPEGYAPILVTAQKQQLIGVRTAPAKRQNLTKVIRTAGRIAYDPELYQAEEEYLQGLRSLEKAKAGSSAPEVIEQAQRLADASRMRLRIMGLSHEFIDGMSGWDGPDKSLLLADTKGRVWLYAPIYEFELPFVKAGQSLTVQMQAIPGKTIEGTIQSIDPVLDPTTRTARARALLTDPDGILKPQMFVNVSLKVELGEVLTIPEEAVFDTGIRTIVFVDKGQGLFEPRDVTVGAKGEVLVEIKEGVAEGERVVTSGNFLIDSESRLKAALQGMTSQEQNGGEHRHGP